LIYFICPAPALHQKMFVSNPTSWTRGTRDKIIYFYFRFRWKQSFWFIGCRSHHFTM